MRANIAKVIAAFKDHKACNGDTCSTDGATIYSYAMPIAWRTGNKITVVLYENGPSRTTKSQIRACEMAFIDANRVDVFGVKP